jgi:hypothetical membrane protein
MLTDTTYKKAGVASILVFFGSLFSFAAAHPDYSHSTKAISELGAFGAPHAFAWNLLGFILPGLLVAICGAGAALAIDARRTGLFWLLAASGLAFSGTGFLPAEMHGGSPVMQSPWTSGHILMSLVSGIAWVLGAFVLTRHVNQSGRWRQMRAPSAALCVTAFVVLAFNVFGREIPVFQDRPGLVQRVAFAAYFGWFVVVAFTFSSGTQEAQRAAA